MKIIRNEQNLNMIMEIIFAENEDPVKCLEAFREIEKERLNTDKIRIEADRAKCEMSHETNRHSMTKNAELAAIQADVLKHQATMNALAMIDANMKPVYPTEIVNKLIDDELKNIELTVTDEDNITDKVKR